jgi:ribosomal protein S18 acetylase RimI-like enzyme
MAGGSPGAKLLALDGAQATIVPVRKWFSIFNSVFYSDAKDLERAYRSLTEHYAQAGVMAWTVWVPPGDRRAASILQSRGHALDSTPMLFAAPIERLDTEPKLELELDVDPRWETVCQVNDKAHGVLEPWSMAAIFQTMADPASHLHVARRNGACAAALVAREQDRDCYFWFVATVPEAQGAGLASELMRHALREARSRGCTTSSLESTAVAERMYERLGYQPLGRYEIWERRSA